MAVNFLNDISKYEFSGFPIGFSRNNPIPLDKTEVWLDLEELKAYAASGATAYVGQKVTYVDVANKTATVYIIADEAGTLTPVGSPTEGDEVSISLDNGVLSLKDFGKRYYEYVAAEGETAAHYELVEVDDNHPWSAGLTPKIVDEDGALVLGWFEPNETTIEGVQDQANEALDKAEQAQEKVEEVNGKVTAVETKVTEVEDRVDEISNILNDTVDEDGEAVEGLVTRVDNLETDITNLYDAVDNTYTKEEVDGKIASVFHYKGKKATYADLLLVTDMIVGDVWEVTDEKKEYAYNGSEWIELGLTVDLSAYATSEYVDAKAKGVQDNLDVVAGDLATHKEEVAGHADAIAANASAIEELQNSNTDLTGNIENLQGQFDTQADELNDLKASVGSPSESFTAALFPTVESLQSRIDGLVATGGEANLINGIAIDGTSITPDASKIVNLPSFSGSTAGLVPVVSTGVEANYVLTASGLWANPFGDMGGLTVKEYVDDAVANAALMWEEI